MHAVIPRSQPLPDVPRWLFVVILGAVVAAAASKTAAQPGANQQQGNLPNVLALPNGQALNARGNATAGTTTGLQGAAANADFDSLIDLIQSTVATATWAENGGGESDIRPFPGGVLVDAAGTLRRRTNDSLTSQLAAKRGTVPRASEILVLDISDATNSVRRESALRFVSLPRLEREIERRLAARRPLELSMLTLAGLQRVQYVFVYPESGDLVLAGPAGDWHIDDGRIVSARTGQPVVRLDDFLVLLRRGDDAATSHFGCSINPRQEALAKTQGFLAASSQKPLEPARRNQWLGELRDSVGLQDIEIFGVDPASRVASVLVEADYHMKLIGMGLADSVDGVTSYLDSVKDASERAGAPPPPMTVLRWWFALNYDAINSTRAGDAFELIGQGVRVLSENEMLAQQGRRVHTGQSDALTAKFAESFTAHYAKLSAKYPVYGELRNVFDLVMAVALIAKNNLAEKAGWSPSSFAQDARLQLPRGVAPTQVETVINHCTIDRRHIVAGVSGGVMVAPSDILRDAPGTDRIIASRHAAAPKDASEIWWWDAAGE